MTVAKKSTRKSAQSMTGKLPAVKKGKAKPNAGAIGAAYAATIIAAAREVGEVIARAGVSMKERLSGLVALPREAHLEFRSTLEAERLVIEQNAAKAKISISAYREADSVADSIYVTVSLWNKLSKAVEAGWKPDLDKPWADISKAATAWLDNAKAKAEQESAAKMMHAKLEAAKLATDKGDTKAAEVLQAEAKVFEAKMKANPVTAAPTTRKGRPAKSLYDQTLELVKDRPIHEVEKLTSQLIAFIMEKNQKNLAHTLEYLRDLITKGNKPTSETTTVKTGTSGEASKEERAMAANEVNPANERRTRKQRATA